MITKENKQEEIIEVCGKKVVVRYTRDCQPCEKCVFGESDNLCAYAKDKCVELDRVGMEIDERAYFVPAEEGKTLTKLQAFLATTTPEELEAKYRELEYLLAPKDDDADKAAEEWAAAHDTGGFDCYGNAESNVESLIPAFKAGIAWERNKPIPEDVQEAANQYIGYPHEVDEGVSTSQRRQAFADGMLAERWRVNRKAEVPEDYDPEYYNEDTETI